MALPFRRKAVSTDTLPVPEQLPKHIGFIMDGNGRWATKRGMPRKFGHREGAKTFHDLTRYCRSIGIQNIYFQQKTGSVQKKKSMQSWICSGST